MIAKNNSLEHLITTLPGYDPFAHDGPYEFVPERAQRLIDFFQEELEFVEGGCAGQPFMLEPWEAAIGANAFGWVNVETGFRRYREVFIYVARKNGKTPFAAGLGLYATCADNEVGAQNYCVAGKRDQAGLVYRHADLMKRRNPGMSRILRSNKVSQSITYELFGNVLTTIPSDDRTAHGFNVHFVVIDELHTQRDRKLVDAMITGTASRDQPMIVYITTADYKRESICNEKYEYACRVRDGIIDDDSFLPVIYEALPEDDWTDPAVWAKANPNLGVSVKEDYLARECKRAQESPSYENTFKRLHLNIRTEQDVRWLQMDRWDLCGSYKGLSDPWQIRLAMLEDFKHMRCWAGLDMATRNDLAALSLVFYDPESRDYHVLPWFWVPEENAEKRAREDRVDYPKWIKQGYVTATAGDVIDFARIRDDIYSLASDYEIMQIGVDPWNSQQLQQELKSAGFDVVAYIQSIPHLTGPTKELEALMLDGRLHHGGNPVLRWMASNATVWKNSNEDIRPDKKRSTDRIDGIVATIMGIGLILIQEKEQPSVYSAGDRGLLVV